MPSIEEGQTSIITVGNLNLINDPTILTYDEVQISMELYLRLFSKESNNNYVLVKFLGSDYFHDFKLYKINSINHDSHSNDITFINNSYLLQFNNQITITTCLVQSISEEDIPNLDSIYVSVPNEVYSILNSKTSDSIRCSFLTKFLKSDIVSKNDIIRSINGEVILCEPVNQGKINENTNIFIIKHEVENKVSVVEESDDEENIQLSNYLTSSLNLDIEDVQYTKFKVKTLKRKIVDSPIWKKEDDELFVYLNNSDLVKLGFPIFNGDSVWLNYGKDKILVKLFTIIEPNRSLSSGFLYVSPILSINLNLDVESEVNLEPCKLKSLQISNIVPVAKSVTISRVASPITLDKTFQQHFFSGLKTSFHSAFKVIKTGDFLPITIDSIISKTMFDLASEEDIIPTGDPDSVAWFKINEVLGEDDQTGQFMIDPLKTRMILSGVEFVRLPCNEFHNWYEYLSLPPLFNYNSLIETGNFAYAKTLKKILLTNLNSKINLKTTILLHSMSRGLGKTTLIRNLTMELGMNLVELDCVNFINPGSELKTVGLISGQIDKLLSTEANDSSFNVIYLKHIENLCVEINENEQGSNVSTSLTLKIITMLNSYFSRKNVVIVFSCNDIDKLNNNLRSLIKFQINFNVPNESERFEIFKFLINNEFTTETDFVDETNGWTGNYKQFPYGIRNDISFQNLALQSAGLTPRDLISIVKKAKNLATKRIAKLCKLEGNKNLIMEKLIKIGNGGVITLIPEDFNKAINDARNQYSDSIGAPRIPNVKWEDIGGLDLVKDEILDTIDMPLKHPELFNNGLKKRSGILFYGPPGTGKTLLAKAIATNFSLNFFSVKGPELLNMYIGESEANVRRVFQKARDAKPCVIFFDELDSVAPKRGNQGDSGGVMDRIVSQLLAELDGMSGGGSDGEGVFVVGATNRPDLLDEALLRPGRFDKMLYLGISDTDEKQVKILEALTRKFKLDDDVDLEKIAEKCSFTFTGADFYALCSDSMLNAMTRIANEVDKKIKKFNSERIAKNEQEVSTRWWFDNVATIEDTDVVVKMVDFLKAQNDLVPSVSAEELDHYLRIRQNFEGGKKAAQGAVQEPQQIEGSIEASIIQNGAAVNGTTINDNANGFQIDSSENGTANGH